MALIGRDQEQAVALDLLSRRGGVLIFGEAGVGKTALAGEVAARIPGQPVARLVATASGRNIPFGGISALFPDLPHNQGLDLASVISRRLGLRAGRRPPMIIVDDLDRLDEGSAAILLSLVVSGEIRLLGTIRSGAVTCDAVTALWKEELVGRVDLGPLTQAQTGEVLAELLGGPVASPSTAVLFHASSGNPLYVKEMTRHGRDRDRFVRRSGLWWWLGDRDVPPRLSDLMLTRVTALSTAGREAAEVLALGEPLPFQALVDATSAAAVDELDRAGIAIADETDGILRLRFCHPMLQSVTEASLSATRRRMISMRLLRVPADQISVVRRAGWHLAAGSVADPELLLAAADLLLLTDLDAAERMASSAASSETHRTAALIMLSHVQSERGGVDAARATLDRAASTAGTDAERWAAALEESSQLLWSVRDPAGALALPDRTRSVITMGYADEIASVEAFTLLFTGHTAAAIDRAAKVLELPTVGRSPRIRALTCLVAGLCFADRGPEALAGVARLEADLLDGPALSTTRLALIEALVTAARLMHGTDEAALPGSTGLLGRWPVTGRDRLVSRPVGPEITGLGDGGWPLLVGMTSHFAGDLERAVTALGEAVVQQVDGEGVFRSEAVADLVVTLCELGRIDEAERWLEATPPDGIAIIPGLSAWSRAAVAGATWRRDLAAELAIEAAETAHRHGSDLMAWVFLTDAGRWGDPRRAAGAVRELRMRPATPAATARAAAIAARAEPRPHELIEAAELQLRAGFFKHATELAELALASAGDQQTRRTAETVIAAARRGIGTQSPADPAKIVAGLLSRREAEVARLAARGRSDREIAQTLTISIRTVQSHLAATYRKLGVASRTELGRLLGPEPAEAR